jgi:hypothetical protein
MGTSLRFVRRYLKLFTYIGLYWSSLIFSLKIISLTLQMTISLCDFGLIVIIVGFIFLTSYFIKKELLLHFSKINRIIKIILRFSLSFALAFYILTFLKGGLTPVWNSLLSSISGYRDVTVVMIVVPFYLILILLFIFGPIILLSKLIMSNSIMAKIFALLIYLIIWALYLYFMLVKGANYNWDELFIELFLPVTKLILGFLPLGWFYQLYLKNLTLD